MSRSASRIRVAAVAVLGVGSFAAAGLLLHRFGSANAVIAYYNGHVLLVEQPDRALGPLAANQKVDVAFPLTNVLARAVEIVGCTSSCSCITTDILPRTIQSGERVDFHVEIIAPAKGTFEHEIELFVDPPGPRIVLKIKGATAEDRRDIR